MPKTAWATTATAAIFRPWIRLEPVPVSTWPATSAKKASARAEGRVKAVKAASAPAPAGAHQAQSETNLAGCGAGQKLAQRYEIGKGSFAEPAAADDELVAKIAQMGDRPAEGGDTQLGEGYQHLAWRAGMFGGSCGRLVTQALPSCTPFPGSA